MGADAPRLSQTPGGLRARGGGTAGGRLPGGGRGRGRRGGRTLPRKPRGLLPVGRGRNTPWGLEHSLRALDGPSPSTPGADSRVHARGGGTARGEPTEGGRSPGRRGSGALSRRSEGIRPPGRSGGALRGLVECLRTLGADAPHLSRPPGGLRARGGGTARCRPTGGGRSPGRRGSGALSRRSGGIPPPGRSGGALRGLVKCLRTLGADAPHLSRPPGGLRARGGGAARRRPTGGGRSPGRRNGCVLSGSFWRPPPLGRGRDAPRGLARGLRSLGTHAPRLARSPGRLRARREGTAGGGLCGGGRDLGRRSSGSLCRLFRRLPPVGRGRDAPRGLGGGLRALGADAPRLTRPRGGLRAWGGGAARRRPTGGGRSPGQRGGGALPRPSSRLCPPGRGHDAPRGLGGRLRALGDDAPRLTRPGAGVRARSEGVAGGRMSGGGRSGGR